MQWSVYISLYLLSLPLFLVIDLFWIAWLASDFYNQQIGALRGDINWLAAILFYVLFLAGLTYFAIAPGWHSGSYLYALWLGAAYGFFVYAAYDLTNMATLAGWTWPMSVVDMVWGSVLGASVTVATIYVYRLVLG